MMPTPGNGLPLARLIFLSSCAIGFGLTDAIYFTFILDALQASGASRLVAFSALALGALFSILLAPFASTLCKDGSSRKRVTLIMLLIAAISALATAIVFGSYRPSFDPPRNSIWRVFTGVFLAAIYRASIQASPLVPAVMDGARIIGDEDYFDIRRDLALSGFYLSYRVGFLISAIVIASLPKRSVENMLPILVSAAVVSCLTIVISMVLMPEERKEEDEELDTDEIKELNWTKVKSDIREVSGSGCRLMACYFETVLYGIAFGQLAAITAPYYNEVIFKVPPGTANGLKWAAYSALLGWGVGIISDAILPLIVFNKRVPKSAMKYVWFLSSMLGFQLFLRLYFETNKNNALVLFGFLAITTATHNQFSLIAAGALVEPRLRATAFGMRAASLHIGLLIGSVSGGLASQFAGYKVVMLISAGATAFAGFATLVIGNVEKDQFNGVAANANSLATFIAVSRPEFEQ